MYVCRIKQLSSAFFFKLQKKLRNKKGKKKKKRRKNNIKLINNPSNTKHGNINIQIFGLFLVQL